MPSSFTANQMFYIGLVVSVLVFIINELARRRGVRLSRRWLTIALYLVSLALAFVFRPIVLPVLPVLPALTGEPPDIVAAILAWLSTVLTQLTYLVGVATAIYNIVGQRVMTSVADRWFGGPVP